MNIYAKILLIGLPIVAVGTTVGIIGYRNGWFGDTRPYLMKKIKERGILRGEPVTPDKERILDGYDIEILKGIANGTLH